MRRISLDIAPMVAFFLRKLRFHQQPKTKRAHASEVARGIFFMEITKWGFNINCPICNFNNTSCIMTMSNYTYFEPLQYGL